MKKLGERQHAVLVADDDPDALALVSLSLSMMGIISIEATDGEKAIAACSQALPDMAILDYNMPGCKGTEVCAHIKKLPGGELIPVLMLTAMDSLQDKVRAFEEGVDDYLTKPFHCQELMARVKALLRVRDLNVRLADKNAQLSQIQEIVLQQERQLVVSQLAGSAAHELGQPLAAIILNCYLLQNLAPGDPKAQKALAAIGSDAKRMSEMLERLKGADAAKTAAYHQDIRILDLGK